MSARFTPTELASFDQRRAALKQTLATMVAEYRAALVEDGPEAAAVGLSGTLVEWVVSSPTPENLVAATAAVVDVLVTAVDALAVPEGKPMSDRFRIHKTDAPFWPWAMDYPDGFSDGSSIGEACSTFDFAIAAFIDASVRRCPDCGRGAVVDTATGWRCEHCGAYDTAVQT